MPDVPRFRPHSADDFYRAYAIAMLNWQNVESSLFRMYYGLFNGTNLSQAGAAYFSLESFGAKLRLVDATAKVVLDENAAKLWEKLKRRVENSSGDRNVLAHLPASVEFQDDGACSLVLTANIFVPTALVRRRKKKYDAAECERLGMDFHALAGAIDTFAEYPRES